MSDLFDALRLFITNTGPMARLEIGGEFDLATVGALRDHLDLPVGPEPATSRSTWNSSRSATRRACPSSLPPTTSSPPSAERLRIVEHPLGRRAAARSSPPRT